MASDDDDFVVYSEEENELDFENESDVDKNGIENRFSILNYKDNTKKNKEMIRLIYGFDSVDDMMDEFNKIRALLLSILSLRNTYSLLQLKEVLFALYSTYHI